MVFAARAPFVRLGAVALAASIWLFGALAAADPVVVVYVAGNPEGVTVTVTDDAGTARSCSTDETGSCEISGLSPGRATVVAQAGGTSGARQTVVIPPDGKVSLFVPQP
jgi:hypothetical protein